MLHYVQGGHRPEQHGFPERLGEFEKLSKSQGNSGNLDFCRKNLENSGRIKNV